MARFPTTSEIEQVIRDSIRHLIEPGQVAELRALDCPAPGSGRPQTIVGFFDNHDELAKVAANLSKNAKGVYVTLNPVDPALLGRAENRVQAAQSGVATTDKDVTRLRWLFVDLDPVRPSGISSTNDEHQAALHRAQEATEFLSGIGWPRPIVADSGNGAHLLYRVSLEPDQRQLVKQVLDSLALRFSDDAVDVDTSVHNPARILKLYGTLAKKGDDTKERPYRRSQILETPIKIEILSQEMMEAFVESSYPAPPEPVETSLPVPAGQHASESMEAFISRNNLVVNGPLPWDGGGQKWIFPVCPFNAEHTNRSAVLLEFSNGAKTFKCHHNGCRDNDWRALRKLLGDEVKEVSITSSVAIRTDSEGESPLTKPPWPTPPEDAAYYGLAGEIVRIIEPHTESDPAALLLQLLVAFGNAAGRHTYFEVEGAKHYMNLFAVLVGATSKGRKGTSWAHTEKLFLKVDKVWTKTQIASGLSTGEGLAFHVRDPITKVRPIKQGGRCTGETEEVLEDVGVEDKRLLAMQPEFASVLKVLSREGNTLSAYMRQAWDTGDLRGLTKSNPVTATGAHISVVAHIVDDELLRYLDTTEAGNGFGNRFLWACVQRSKCLPDGGNLDESDLEDCIKELGESLEFAAQERRMAKDEGASKLWHEVYEKLSEGRPGMSGALTSRAEAQVMRLATIYAALERSERIREPHLSAALDLWDYCDRSVRHVFGNTLGDPHADAILRELEGKPEGLTRTDISKLFNRHGPSSRIGQALQTLRQYGYAYSVREATDGRPVERWFAGRGNDTNPDEKAEAA